MVAEIIPSQEEGIVSFLAFFNEIDKHFDKVLNEEGFSPYNEKLKKIADGNYTISSFVRKHLYQLRNFGELRNFITHGIKSNGETYAQKITEPAKVLEFFQKPVFTAKKSDLLSEIIPLMKGKNYTNIPIYDDQGNFAGILSESRLLYRIADLLMSDDYLNLKLMKVDHIQLNRGRKDYLFISSNTTIFEVNDLFTQSKRNGEKLGVLFITENGDPNEELLGMISSGDANLIDEYIIM